MNYNFECQTRQIKWRKNIVTTGSSVTSDDDNLSLVSQKVMIIIVYWHYCGDFIWSVKKTRQTKNVRFLFAWIALPCSHSYFWLLQRIVYIGTSGVRVLLHGKVFGYNNRRGTCSLQVNVVFALYVLCVACPCKTMSIFSSVLSISILYDMYGVGAEFKCFYSFKFGAGSFVNYY